jgi:flagellin FlaB
MTTGQETVAEVATGLAVFDIEGHVNSGNIDKLFIGVRPRAGSADIDMNEIFVEIANTSHKMILNYTSNMWNDSAVGVDDLFGLTTVWSSSARRFGITVMEDADSSVAQTTPTINRGDKVLITVKADTIFSGSSGIAVRTDIWGAVIPEHGSPGVIAFTTPASYGQTTVHDLQ